MDRKSKPGVFIYLFLAVYRPFSKVYNFLHNLYGLFMLSYRSYTTKAFII